jgi:hypothetical protein
LNHKRDVTTRSNYNGNTSAAKIQPQWQHICKTEPLRQRIRKMEPQWQCHRKIKLQRQCLTSATTAISTLATALASPQPDCR